MPNLAFMVRNFRGLALSLCAILVTTAAATAKEHTITFGKWISVQWAAIDSKPGPKALPMKVRSLVIDGRVREYVLGPAHDVTERLFVVRRAFRLNDGLPEEKGPQWQWQRGGWLLVDRAAGHISALSLPQFDA